MALKAELNFSPVFSVVPIQRPPLPLRPRVLNLPYLSTQFVHFFLVAVALVVVVAVVDVAVVDVVVVVVVVVFHPLKSKTAKMSIKTQLCSSFSFFFFLSESYRQNRGRRPHRL